jgi:glycosyltransferase involved in cell wall biosynthesis
MRRVLFVSHEATRTGAPLFLLNLLRWLRPRAPFELHVMLREDGELRSEFEAVASVSLFDQERASPRLRAPGQLSRSPLRRFKSNVRQRSLLARLERKGIDLIYSNTIANGAVLMALSDLRLPVITHVHELEWVIQSEANWGSGRDAVEFALSRSDRLIAVSDATRENLIFNHGVVEERISVIPGATPLPVSNQLEPSHLKARLLERFNLPTDSTIICAAGTTDLRKGTDLFVQLAYHILRLPSLRPVYLLWIGGDSDSPLVEMLKRDLVKLGLVDNVRFLGYQDDPAVFIGGCDIFVLVSREDPFPLVCLEAASFAKPVICFDRAGGAPEMVEHDAGIRVPYLDVSAMAESARALIDSPERARSLGTSARAKVIERYTFDVIGPRILQEIERLLP